MASRAKRTHLNFALCGRHRSPPASRPTVSGPSPSLLPPTPPSVVPLARVGPHAERRLQPTGGVGSDRVAGGAPAPARASAHGGAEVSLGLARPLLLEQGGAQVDLRRGVGWPQRQRRPQRVCRLGPPLLPAQRISERVERCVQLLGRGWVGVLWRERGACMVRRLRHHASTHRAALRAAHRAAHRTVGGRGRGRWGRGRERQ
eukprot:scaffold60383_cov53-Phaeocystis_antarctica.AAC.1